LHKDEPTAGEAREASIPRATYRIQLNAQFTFKDATAIIPYLAELGISHVYCSPYFRARAGSTHGYDVVDHNAFNPEIGDRDDFERFVAELRAHGMGHVLDIVPNHVGIMGADNARWMDVLENGQASIYADFFDIDWTPANPGLAGKVLVPVLGDPYGVVLERGELELRFESELGSFAMFYHEHRFPLDPRTYPRILDRVLAHTSNAELDALRRRFRDLPGRQDPTQEQIQERHREKEACKQALARLHAADRVVAAAIDAGVRSLAGNPNEPFSFDALHELLEAQAYRLAYWRVASDDINYRRFFDVNSLAGLRVENEAVFEATHKLLLDLVGAGKIDGLRVDHPDGLYDPAGYFRRLQKRVGEVTGNPATRPIYLVVEKITASFEHLPPEWPVHGETGYHFANVVNRMLVDPATRGRLDRVYTGFIDEHLEWQNVAYECQHLVLRRSLASELNTVANQLARIAELDRRSRDFTFNSLRQALAEVIACFPVYRTYIAPDMDQAISESDRRYIEWAVATAKRRRSSTETPVLDFVRSALLLELPAPTDRVRHRMRAFVLKFQQITAPTTAKGLEDTALYRFNRLAALNEVGGEPDLYGTSPQAFHADSQYRAKNWPNELLGTSTHDTKRSEDVRARISVLSEMTMVWRKTIDRWNRMNRSRKREVDGRRAPSRNDEYLFYQTLIGCWPLEELDAAASTAFRERIQAYMIKAAREAKLRTSWANINTEYEEALTQFVQTTLEPREGNLFLSDLMATQRRLVRFGLLNSLSQTVCKLTAPGVPDIYQGNDLWDFSLVDPDNRRPVDYAKRRALLAELRERGADLRALLDPIPDDRCKLFLTWKILQFRAEHEELFRRGEYVPLRVNGAHATNVCAFARRCHGELLITIAPRLYLRLLGDRELPPLGEEVWGDTAVELPREVLNGAGALHNLIDGSEVAVADLEQRPGLRIAAALANFPVAVLYRSTDSHAPAK
jgi:(1->4)-alpha-D-glucan 1-alpha-D-glucosylmutase